MARSTRLGGELATSMRSRPNCLATCNTRSVRANSSSIGLTDAKLRDPDRDGGADAVADRFFRDGEAQRLGEHFGLARGAGPRHDHQGAAVVAAEGVFGPMPRRLGDYAAATVGQAAQHVVAGRDVRGNR